MSASMAGVEMMLGWLYHAGSSSTIPQKSASLLRSTRFWKRASSCRRCACARATASGSPAPALTGAW